MVLIGLIPGIAPLGAETGTQMNLEINNGIYRGRGTQWFYGATGLADLRVFSSGKSSVKAEAALEFFPRERVASGGGSESRLTLKRLWIKVNFPSWRLTAGKTRVAWGNGVVFNSGDILFGSLSPYLDFTQSTIRHETAFLTSFNIPLGRFSYLEAVVMPPNLDSSLQFQPANHISGGMRAFFRVNGFRLETGYLYKGDAKVANDILGHRPYFSFHGHAGIDFYGSLSFAAGADPGSGDGTRDTWDEISRTLSISIGGFHQIQVGYDGTLSFRFEALIMPWQNWTSRTYQEILSGTAGYYGLMLYPEIRWNFASAWSLSLQSLISPIDASTQLTAGVTWNAMQGLTFLGFLSAQLGEESDLFAWDRSGSWPNYPKGHLNAGDGFADSSFNGIGITLGARYSY